MTAAAEEVAEATGAGADSSADLYIDLAAVRECFDDVDFLTGADFVDDFLGLDFPILVIATLVFGNRGESV